MGCGTGQLVQALRRLGIDARGLELSQEAIDLSENAVKPFLVQGDIVDIPFKENNFEMVVSFDVLEHLERSKLKKSVKETVRVAKKAILHKIYTSENTFINRIHGEDASHVSVFTQGFWDRMFNEMTEVVVARKFFRLPSFIETVYLLKKS